MNKNALKSIDGYEKQRRQFKHWQKIVTCLAAVVVFVTTYALILPAITMEDEIFCGFEDHQHSAENGCYEQRLICQLPEGDAHVHTSECYTKEKTLICSLTEQPSHTHTDKCIQTERILICEDASSEHEHSDECYQEIQTYLCGQEESSGHTHSDACYETMDILTCERLEEELHTHTEECYEQVLVCGKPEHTHTLICYSDQNADLETAAKWEKTLEDVALTGDWAEDVVAIANSQLGYIESERNYTVIESEDGDETKKGYSRYGAWYGDSYGDWCAMFVSFCLHYADADEFPAEANCQRWVTQFKTDEVWEGAASYVPGRGDLIFFDYTQDGTAQHVGIVEEYDAETQTVHTIEGNTSDTVARREYALEDSSIMGYCSMTAAIQKYAPALKLEYVGADYTVVACVPKEAALPGNVALSVRELTGDEYEEYCRQAMDAMGLDEIHFARFFDITFLADGEEVEPAAPIQIEITYSDNVNLEDNQISGVVHFAATDTEVLDTEIGQDASGATSFTFTQNSFSVSGTVSGGITAYADNAGDTSDHPVGSVSGVQVETPTVGEWYILYVHNPTGDPYNPGFALGSDAAAAYALSQSSDNRGTVAYEGNADVLWQYTEKGFRNRSGEYLTLACTGINPGGDAVERGMLGKSTNPSHANVKYSKTYHALCNEEYVSGNGHTDVLVTNYLHFNGYNGPVHCRSYNAPDDWGARGDIPAYIAQVTYNSGGGGETGGETGGGSGVLDGKHPLGVITGDISENDIILYNVDGTGSTVQPLAGVGYTIWDSTGKAVKKLTTVNSFALSVGNLPDGSYTIQQTSVPDEYVVYPQTKTFTVTDGVASPSLGVFYDYKQGSKGYNTDKTAQVIDYINRIYKVDLSANSGRYEYSISNLNFSLVIDRSNSMLFPAELVEEATVTLEFNGNNNEELNTKLTDKNQVYYVITKPAVSATVWAIWWNESDQSWYYQDASYYAKAQEAGGYNNNTDDGKTVIFADETITDSSTQKKGSYGSFADGFTRDDRKVVSTDWWGNKTYSTSETYQVYTGKTYNRLHYLQEAMRILINELAALDDQHTSVTIATFANDFGLCETAGQLDAAGVKKLQDAVDRFTTSSGTNPAAALNHLINDSHISGDQKDYVILITDGAPNSTSYQSNAITAADAVKDVKNTTLYTVGLATEYVTWAQNNLKNMASRQSCAFEAEDASMLADILMSNILSEIKQEQISGTAVIIKDIVSDSFYPVDANGAVLTDGTVLHLDGTACTHDNKTDHGDHHIGILHNDPDNGWYLEWLNQMLPAYDTGQMWSGSIYLKAKEDFIGGNAIDTNKSATITLMDDDGNEATIPIELSSPNVNVRLLPMVAWSAEATVFLSDQVNRDTNGNGLPDILDDFYHRIGFSKLGSYTDGIYHRNNMVASADYEIEKKLDADTLARLEGLTSTEFSLYHALGEALTAAQWNTLAGEDGKGNYILTVPYTYDEDSSHGPVGEFTLQIRKSGKNSDFESHPTEDIGNHVEVYYLDVAYRAYSLTERGLTNEHNAGDGPGNEVGTGTTLEDGAGTITVEDEYDVNVVDGKITVTKEIDPSLISDQDQTFEYTLYKLTVDAEDHELSRELYNTGTITVLAGNTTGAMATIDGQTTNTGELAFLHLPRGNYLVVETSGENYYVRSVQVAHDGEDATNCFYHIENNGTTAAFHIGYELETNADDIQYGIQIDDHHIIYSWTDASLGAVGDGHNFSHGKVTFVNTVTTHEGTVPVEKQWASDTGNHSGDTVYVALCDSQGNPLLYEDGSVHLVKLNEENQWKASFSVHLPFGKTWKDMNYTIREVYEIREQETDGYQKAVVVNDKDAVLYYGALAGPNDAAIVNGTGYLVRYSTGSNGTLIVLNQGTYELPKTGGVGTKVFTIGGLALIAGCLLYGCVMRRKRERRIE